MGTSGFCRPAQPARVQKKEYEVLPAGREELAAWVSRAEDPRPVRDPLLLRTRAAAVVGAPGLVVELRRHLAPHQERLAEYLEIEERDFPPERTSEEDRLRHLVLRGGIDLETFWTGWLTRALDDLEGTTAPAAASAEPGEAAGPHGTGLRAPGPARRATAARRWRGPRRRPER